MGYTTCAPVVASSNCHLAARSGLWPRPSLFVTSIIVLTFVLFLVTPTCQASANQAADMRILVRRKRTFTGSNDRFSLVNSHSNLYLTINDGRVRGLPATPSFDHPAHCKLPSLYIATVNCRKLAAQRRVAMETCDMCSGAHARLHRDGMCSSTLCGRSCVDAQRVDVTAAPVCQFRGSLLRPGTSKLLITDSITV